MPYIAYQTVTGAVQRRYHRSGPLPLDDPKKTTSIKLYQWQRERLVKYDLTVQEVVDLVCAYEEILERLGNTKSV